MAYHCFVDVVGMCTVAVLEQLSTIDNPGYWSAVGAVPWRQG